MNQLKSYYHRRLPHYQPIDAILFSTFRLAHSLPKAVLQQLLNEYEQRKKLVQQETDGEKRAQLLSIEQERYFGHFDEYLDRITNDIRWLQDQDIARIVYESILFYDGKECTVVAFCIMPNHVHVVFNMREKNIPLHDILKKIKTYSALHSNRILKRKGKFWHNENYDHVVRHADELKRIITYTITNPVKAMLTQKWEEWKWTYVNKKYLE